MRGIAVGNQVSGWVMTRIFSLLFATLVVLAGCVATPPNSEYGASGTTNKKAYRIRGGDTAKIQFRMLDSVNALRQASGSAPVTLNPQLNAAAATHSRDMSVQNRPWHFGSDGSSPIDRVQRAGYTGQLLGEAISETYETELETLAAWMEEPGTRGVIMEPRAVSLGFSWFQESNGKIWWTLVMGG